MTHSGRDPLVSYRRAVASGHPAMIENAARECRLTVEDALPVVLAVMSNQKRYGQAVEKWLGRFRAEVDPPAEDAEIDLARAALRAPHVDMTAIAGGDALLRLLDARGMAFARSALDAWLNRLE